MMKFMVIKYVDVWGQKRAEENSSSENSIETLARVCDQL